MRKDFVVFIITNGRPDKVYTYQSLRKSGYTGPVYLVIDDEDPHGPAYRERYGHQVVTFCKREWAARSDTGDNFPEMRSILFGRNACFEFAKQFGYRYFMQLDDDYTGFFYQRTAQLAFTFKPIKQRLDDVFEALVTYFAASPFHSIAMSQGGDYIGGKDNLGAQTVLGKRKAMNSFICDVERPFQFVGRFNEDVNAYTSAQRRGVLFLTIMQVGLRQKQTQKTAGGLTELYLQYGTYVKSFYSVMYAPSGAKIRELTTTHRRIHHGVSYNAIAPLILPEHVRKTVAPCA